MAAVRHIYDGLKGVTGQADGAGRDKESSQVRPARR